jgi:hypothetical protein
MEKKKISQREKAAEAAKTGPAMISDPGETGGVVKAKREVLIDEPLWQEGPYSGTHPTNRLYSQNFDLSVFPLLLERTYAELENEEPRLRREIPFCAFQHVFTGVLQATLIDHVRTVNAEDRFADEESPANLIPEDMAIPGPIDEYLKLLTNSSTPQGDVVRLNVPDGGIPQEPIPAQDGRARIPSGSFGVIGADNHNSYECYVSPLVTSRLVEATIAQNSAHQYVPWQPLPPGCFPAGAIPTRNLLGYRPNVERLNQEGLQALVDATFADGATMAGRLRWSPELVARVSGTLKRLDGKYRCVIGRPRHGTNSAALGWTVVDAVPTPTEDRLVSVNSPVYCSVALGQAQCNIAGMMALKRERTVTAMGLSYVSAARAAIAGWADTINANFLMRAPYGPMAGSDLPVLRNRMHVNTAPAGDRGLALTTWIRTHFHVKRDRT